MKGFCPLGSGSKGNVIFLGTDQTKILIDAGLSTKAIKERLESIDIDIGSVDAILVTHDHIDHIRAIQVMASRYQIPILANAETAKGIAKTCNDIPKFKIFSTNETFQFKDLEIHPFSISHDTLDPVAFTIHHGPYKMGFCTDLGFAPTLVKMRLKQCDWLYVEANHEPSMVHASARPAVYKQRVLSRIGHLSNEDCAELIDEVNHSNLKKVYLAHLSSECNSEGSALKNVHDRLEDRALFDLIIAQQDAPSEPTFF